MLRSSAPFAGKDAQRCKMRFLPQVVSDARPHRTSFGLCFGVITTGLALAMAGWRRRPRRSARAGDGPGSAFTAGRHFSWRSRGASADGLRSIAAAVQQAGHPASWVFGIARNTRTGDRGAAARDVAGAGVIPGGISLDQAISATLLADPKIRAGLEAIHQANANSLTSSLPPNPTLITDGIFLPLRPFTPANPGGPTQMDVMVGYPIDWFLFGKRAAAMASASLGVRQSEADYADLIRQRVTATAIAYYDVLEAKSLRKVARQDTENLTRLEAATRKAVEAGGRPVVDLNRVHLDLLKSQQDLREADCTLDSAKAKLRRSSAAATPTHLSTWAAISTRL